MQVVRERKVTPQGVATLAALDKSIASQVGEYHTMANVPAGSMVNIRNDMYVVSEGLRYMSKDADLKITDADKKALSSYKGELDHSTKFIPSWVKVAGRYRLRSRHHDRLEAHRRDGGRKNRQDASDLRAGRLGGNCRDGDHWRRRTVRPAGEHDARAVLWRRPALWSRTSPACSGRPCATC